MKWQPTATKNGTNDAPTVTVIVPHFGCERFLSAAVGSVLAQTVTSIEVRVVDDASRTDDWLRALAPHLDDRRLRLGQTTKRVGPYRIINALLPSIRTDLIAFQDADDLSHSERFARQLCYMECHGLDVVGCLFDTINENGESLQAWRTPRLWLLRRQVRRGLVAHHPTTLIKRSLLVKLRGYDGTTLFGADTDFMRRAKCISRIGTCPEVLYHYRQRRDSLTTSPLTGSNSEARRRYKTVLADRAQEWRKESDPSARARLLEAARNDLTFTIIPVPGAQDAMA